MENDNRPKIEASSRRRIDFNIDKTWNDIPEDSDTCSACGGHIQKEFLEFTNETNSLVVSATAPGYGCTGCELKHFDDITLLSLLNGASGQFRRFGDEAQALRLEEEAASFARARSITFDGEQQPPITS